MGGLSRLIVSIYTGRLSLNQGSPNFFVRGAHKLLQNIPRTGRLTSCDCFGICCILPNQQNLV